jgi:hypothetical protein
MSAHSGNSPEASTKCLPQPTARTTRRETQRIPLQSKKRYTLRMAAKQGLNRLFNGAKKQVTNSEAARGYLFVTNDKLARQELGGLFNVKLGIYFLKDRSIDTYGRISVGRAILKEFKNVPLRMRLSRGILQITPE